MKWSQNASKTMQEKRNEFSVAIRRDQKRKYIDELRRKKFKLLPLEIKPEDLVEYFELQNDPRFAPQNIKQQRFWLVNILLARAQNLYRVSYKDNDISRRVDEKLLPPPESQLELQDVQLPKQYPLKLQAGLFNALATDMDSNKGKYKLLGKKEQYQLVTFWLKFLKRNKYTETMRHKEYHVGVINFLSQFVNQIDSPDLRELILKWVQGIQGLSLIFDCLPGYFINVHKYSRIYDIIGAGLNHKDIEKKTQAIDVLLKCIKMSDYDDIADLLQNKSSLFSSLIRLFEDPSVKSMIYQDKEVMNSFKKAVYCLTVFLQTYDEYIFGCVREGAGYVAAVLICQQDTSLVKDGLHIFNIIANIQDTEFGRDAQNFLLYDTSINQTGVWERIGQSYSIVNHPDIEVRRLFVMFINAFLGVAEFHEIVLLIMKFNFPNDENLADILMLMFEENNDLVIWLNILKSFQSLFYYNMMEVEGMMEMDNWNNKAKRVVDEIFTEVIFEKMEGRGVIKRLEEIENMQGNDGQLKQEATLMLEYLSRKVE